MSVAPRSNRLLFLIGGVVLAATVFIVTKSLRSKTQSYTMKQIPQAAEPDADTPADTIRTLTANVASMTSKVDALREENEKLLRQRQEIEAKVSQRLQRTIDEKLAHVEPSPADGNRHALDGVTQRISLLAQQMERIKQGLRTQTQPTPGAMPIGGAPAPADRPAMIWVEPLDRADSSTEAAPGRVGMMSGSVSMLHPGRPTTPPPGDDVLSRAAAAVTKVLAKPVYTIPKNATLLGSVSWTALVGRVPVKGVVRDPMKFKALIGRDNLAANGIRAPGVEGMVVSGVATGDWTLGCVRGRITSATFVFDDGAISTVTEGSLGGATGGRRGDGGNSKSAEGLGWISDAWGYPCVSGRKVSNAKSFMLGRFALVAAQVAADAVAQAETTQTLSAQTGVQTTTVGGSIGKYVLGKALGGGLDELRQWLSERQAQSFDVVWAPPGTEIAIHIDSPIPIDHDPKARKVFYASNPYEYRPAALD